MKKYRVHMHSKPSPAWAFYQGHVDVWAGGELEAGVLAKLKLKRTTFRDRPENSWTVDKIEEL